MSSVRFRLTPDHKHSAPSIRPGELGRQLARAPIQLQSVNVPDGGVLVEGRDLDTVHIPARGAVRGAGHADIALEVLLVADELDAADAASGITQGVVVLLLDLVPAEEGTDAFLPSTLEVDISWHQLVGPGRHHDFGELFTRK